MKIGIIREGKNPPDKRVAFTPKQCAQIKEEYKVDVVVESSNIRAFSDDEYIAEGLQVVQDVSDCDVLFGVKEVPMNQLIPDKTYFFFSHTIKKQAYNRELLQTIINKNIKLIDYETLTQPTGERVVAFGRYAGIVGAYNGLRMYGLKTGRFNLIPAHECKGKAELDKELDKVDLPKDFRIVLTGGGRVGGGALEVLHKAGIRQVFPKEFLGTTDYNEPVVVQLHVEDYNERQDGAPFKRSEFYSNPEGYQSTFMRFAQCSDMYVAAHFWNPVSPFIFTREDAKSSDFKIAYVADISCDIDCAVASTLQPSAIADPFYGYNAQKESITEFQETKSIAVMAVDNLPCELPRDASEDFGKDLLKSVMPALLVDDSDKVVHRATVTNQGKLTDLYQYLSGYLAGEE